MSQDPPARMHGLQTPLPLVDTDEGTTGRSTTDVDVEWHLDEHTREVGRRGIAEARARLSATRRGGRGRRPTDDAPGRARGRAA